MFLMFTGQGSQFIGMGKSFMSFREMRQTMEEVDDALSEPFSKFIMEGDQDAMMQTVNAQPAIVAVSIGIFRVLKARFNISSTYMAGHSAGEYSALVAAGSISLADAVRIVQIRGRAMQEACPLGYGSMAAILGLEFDAVCNMLSGKDLLCFVANDNGGGQTVISGEKSAVAKAIELLKSAGAKRAIELNVSAPFHTPLIKDAEAKLSEALGGIKISLPEISVIANVTAKPYVSMDEIRELLVRQVSSVVRWRETVIAVAATETKFCLELGPAPVLSKLATRIDGSLQAMSVCEESDLIALEEYLARM